jgi:hypothetical protein
MDWTLVLVAAISAVPATVAAIAALHTRQAIKTPSKTSIGKQVEDALHTTLANNYRLQALVGELDVPMPDKAAAQEAKVEALNDVHTNAERAKRG